MRKDQSVTHVSIFPYSITRFPHTQGYLYSTTNNRLQVWKASDNFALLNELETRYGAIYSLAVSRRFLVTGEGKSFLFIEVPSFQGVLSSGVQLFLSPAGTHSQNIQVYDRTTLKHCSTLNGHIGIVTVLRLTESPHGVFMFSASSDTTVQVSMRLQRHFLSSPSLSLSFSLSRRYGTWRTCYPYWLSNVMRNPSKLWPSARTLSSQDQRTWKSRSVPASRTTH